MKRMKLIGLTGQSGAGKSVVSDLLSREGVMIIDADRVYHSLLLPPSDCINELCAYFGNEILAPDKTVDRKKLSEIVFSKGNEGKLKKLNEITHKYVIKEIDRLIEEYRSMGAFAVLIDAPLLIEAGIHEGCDTVISVLAPFDVRLKRIMERDSISEEKALARLTSQKEDAFYVDSSDLVLINDSTVEALESKLNELLPDILS